jgi:hypothetical protein
LVPCRPAGTEASVRQLIDFGSNALLVLQRNNKHAEAAEYWRRYLANDKMGGTGAPVAFKSISWARPYHATH